MRKWRFVVEFYPANRVSECFVFSDFAFLLATILWQWQDGIQWLVVKKSKK